MKLIELAGGKPSDIVKAMINGLENSHQWPHFMINMGSYGHKDDFYELCFGCAATCAILEISGMHPRLNDYRVREEEKVISVSKEECIEFEFLIDEFRIGLYRSLFELFNNTIPKKKIEPVKPKTELLILSSETWRDNLEPYKLYAKQLEELGL